MPEPAGAGPLPDHLFGIAYGELRRLARAVRHDRADATLSTTELLHEAWLKLQPLGGRQATDSVHFKRILARAMRQVLIDGARRRRVRSRHRESAQAAEPLGPVTGNDDRLAGALLDLDAALTELAERDPRRAAVVECRFFGDMEVEETAEALGLSTATVKRDWRFARAWLAQALDEPEP